MLIEVLVPNYRVFLESLDEFIAITVAMIMIMKLSY